MQQSATQQATSAGRSHQTGNRVARKTQGDAIGPASGGPHDNVEEGKIRLHAKK